MQVHLKLDGTRLRVEQAVGKACEYCIQLGNILLINKYPYLFPWDCISEWKNNVICNNNRDATKYHSFYQSWAPRGPSKWAQTKHGSLHVLVVSGWMLSGDVKQQIVLKVLPHCCSCASARLQNTVSFINQDYLLIQVCFVMKASLHAPNFMQT